MRTVLSLCAVILLLGWTDAGGAHECPGNPDALGTERVLAIDATEHPRIGTMQYPESLPLADKEVVLTFDDGPVPAYTNRILETLAAECVKATFFIVGRQAHAYPAEVRKVYNAGHTVATHSQNHPLIFTRLSIGAAKQEIEQGIASVTAALGDARAVAPFFRFPGLGRSRAIEAYLAAQGIMVWSADFPADDWTHISADQVMKRALERLERRGRGILLLHDIQPATALMLPHLLRTLKERGYHIVHVVPAGPERPATVTEPESWVMRKPKPTVWPMVMERTALTIPAPSLQSFGWPRPFRSGLVLPAPAYPHPERSLFAKLVEALGGSQATPQAISMESSGGPSTRPVAPVDRFPIAADLIDQPARPALVASDATLASMIAPDPPAAAPKPRPALLRLRRPTTPKAPAPHAAAPPRPAASHAALQPPAPLLPPRVIARAPGPPQAWLFWP